MGAVSTFARQKRYAKTPKGKAANTRACRAYRQRLREKREAFKAAGLVTPWQ